MELRNWKLREVKKMAQRATLQTVRQSVVAVCGNLPEAKSAIARLKQHGFPTDHISLVARGLEDDSELHGYVNYGDHTEKDAGIGGLAGGIFGALVGAAFFWIPGFGPLLVIGPLVSGMTGFVVGALIGAMVGWGIPEDQVAEYQQKVKQGKYLVIAHGDPQQVDTAATVLREGNCEEVHLHAKTSADSPEINDSPD